MIRYYIIIFDKNHIKLVSCFLKSFTDYPYKNDFVYFVYKNNDCGFVPICKVEKSIIDMTFTSRFNFSHLVSDI